MSRKPKNIVSEGYDAIAREYAEFVDRFRTDERRQYTSLLLRELPPGVDLLELGCGSGEPTTRLLADRFNVTGVDISKQQIKLAENNIKNATFVHADMTKLDFSAQSFDAVAAFYSIFHIPRAEQPQLLKSIAQWLRLGGLLVAAMSSEAEEAGYEKDWLGVSMFWSGYDTSANKRLVEQAGLKIVSAREETADEFGQPVTFLWIVAKKV